MEDISRLIKERMFDSTLIETLEAHVSEQVKSGTHDFQANRHLLKLYQMFPDMIRIEILAQVLIKALMDMPRTSFLSCTYLVSDRIVSMEPVKTIFKLASCIESCQFKKFWNDAREEGIRPYLEAVVGFHDAIREFIVSVIEVTFREIQASVLKDLVHLNTKEEIDRLIDARGWTRSEDGKNILMPKNSSNQPPRVVATERISIERRLKCSH